MDVIILSKHYKPKEFAELLNVSVITLQRWDNNGKLKAFRTPTNRRYYTYEQYLEYKGIHKIDCQYKCNTLYLCCIKDLCRCFISETLAGSIIYYSNNSIKLFLTYRRKIKPFRIKLS